MLAYYRTPKKLRNHITLIIIRTDSRGNLLLSKPCENCTRKLKNKSITIFYS